MAHGHKVPTGGITNGGCEKDFLKNILTNPLNHPLENPLNHFLKNPLKNRLKNPLNGDIKAAKSGRPIRAGNSRGQLGRPIRGGQHGRLTRVGISGDQLNPNLKKSFNELKFL